jgi:DNA-binding CsgD family transcriptional regulator
MSASTMELIGREPEIAATTTLLDAVKEQGGALLLRGEPGIGKSALLEYGATLARDRGMRVLTAAGVQSETNLPFTGLYELLRPILKRAEALPGLHYDALRGAFGLAEGASADLFLIALGALELLAELASEHPLLVAVDDAQWLDQSTANVLAFIARRVQSEAIVFLLASREGTWTPLDALIPELRIAGLDESAAKAVLDLHYPNLRPSYRQRILAEAAGNPLALVELGKAIESERAAGGVLGVELPLTGRLERAFAWRTADLPHSSRMLLLTAALNDGNDIAETMHAAKLLEGVESSLAALDPAIAAGLIDVDVAKLRFRHPLIRSAVLRASTVAERVAVHSALAETLHDDVDRRTWHRAAATIGADDEIAYDLELVAARAEGRGDMHAAIRALDRAAELSSDPRHRGRCWVRAAEMAFEIGWLGIVVDVLARAETADLSPHDRFKLMWYRKATIGPVSGSDALLEIAESIKNEADADLALDLMCIPAAKGAWWIGADVTVRKRLLAAVESVLVEPEDDPRFLLVSAIAEPLERGAFILDGLRRLLSKGESSGDARIMGLAAALAGDPALSQRFTDIAEARLRREGRLTLLALVLSLRTWNAISLSHRDVAVASAEEAYRLALETDQRTHAAAALGGVATLAALTGDEERAERLATDAEALSQIRGFMLREIVLARAINALGAGRYDDAYRHFGRLFDPNDPAYQPWRRCWHIGDFAEAAVPSGHRDEAVELLRRMEELTQRTPAPQFHAAVHHARAILADDAQAEQCFEDALALGALQPAFTKGRLLFAYGAWLRRARRAREARPRLEAAIEIFDVLSAKPWSERARAELRAAGVVSERRQTAEQREQLTPQELQIALLVAEGLSNREIAQRLYLSHRTIGSHLYRIFPKLGITSRSQVRGALRSD